MKKRSFKKIALLGLAAGVLSVKAEGKNLLEPADFSKSDALAYKKCKGANGCPGMKKKGGEIAQADKEAGSKKESNDDDDKDPNGGNLGYHLMTEDELLLELSDEGTKLYNSLTPEGKLLAREVASSRCNAANVCKGLNSCKTDENDCAGKGQCKGQGKCAIADKNLAVKLVAEKMAKKRAEAAKP